MPEDYSFRFCRLGNGDVFRDGFVFFGVDSMNRTSVSRE